MRWIERQWQTKTFASWLLLPLALLYGVIVAIRRRLYEGGWLRRVRVDVPVIIVGNITVGGSGKTPFVLWLVQRLRELGWRPGIITRGYGGAARAWPQLVTAESDASVVGDEPLLLARRADVPVVAGPDRVRTARQLIALGCDVLVSDDGLQHYRLARDIEIAVIDGDRRGGNGRLLPAGPLRESVARLNSVHARVVHGRGRADEWTMALMPLGFRRVGGVDAIVDPSYFRGRTAHAVAGIGYPPRFFAQLRELGLTIIEHAFPDHYRFQPGDLALTPPLDIIMTEKDAVKCEPFANDAMWYLVVEARIDAPGFNDWLQQRLKRKHHG
jgi:tetraacyldisaccharide 4'-kinase